jgi:hypothetical protein
MENMHLKRSQEISSKPFSFCQTIYIPGESNRNVKFQVLRDVTNKNTFLGCYLV